MSKISLIRLSDLLKLAVNSLRRNRLRSLLTIGAIGVGIAVMLFLISLGMGLEKLTLGSIENSVRLLTLTIQPIGADNIHPLTPAAVGEIEQIPHVKAVLPQLSLKGEVVLNRHAPTTIIGVDPSYFGLSSETSLTIGQAFGEDDTTNMVVSTGFLALFGLDPSKTPLVSFQVILDKTDFPEASALSGMNVSGVVTSDAAIIYLPRKLLENKIMHQFNGYGSANVLVDNQNNIQMVSQAIISQGYRVQSVIDTVQQIRHVFYWIRFILAALGLTAIFVASLGMFNTLTISLLERTREIGIMKALGVKKLDILRLFLTESFLIGLFGGILGIMLAIILEQLTIFIFYLLASFVQGIVPSIFDNPPLLLLGFLLFSIIIALITGIYPAWRATRISPIEAIRYE